MLAGGAQGDYDEALPLLSLWGAPERVRRVGEVGSGSALKLCVNQSIGVLAAGLGESLRLGRELGLDRELLLEVLGATGYGWFLGQKRSMLDSGDFSATTFSVDLMAKDLRLAVEAAHGDAAGDRGQRRGGRGGGRRRLRPGLRRHDACTSPTGAAAGPALSSRTCPSPVTT